MYKLLGVLELQTLLLSIIAHFSENTIAGLVSQYKLLGVLQLQNDGGAGPRVERRGGSREAAEELDEKSGVGLEATTTTARSGVGGPRQNVVWHNFGQIYQKCTVT
jgi:hypothetical protein